MLILHGFSRNYKQLFLQLYNNFRVISNYMMWRAARASLGYFTEDARKIQLDFAKNVTGKKSDTDRWKQCTGEIHR